MIKVVLTMTSETGWTPIQILERVRKTLARRPQDKPLDPNASIRVVNEKGESIGWLDIVKVAK